MKPERDTCVPTNPYLIGKQKPSNKLGLDRLIQIDENVIPRFEFVRASAQSAL